MRRRRSWKDHTQIDENDDRAAVVAEEIVRLRPSPGDILLFHHPERFRSRVIAWFTRSPFYHVGIYEGDGSVIEARIPEVMRRDLYSQRDGFRFIVIRAPGPNTGAAALAWAQARIGAPYDLRAVSAYVVARLLHLPGLCRLLCPAECERFVCGNFVVRAFAAAGISLFPGRHPAEIVPADFAALYRGKDYRHDVRPSRSDLSSLATATTGITSVV